MRHFSIAELARGALPFGREGETIAVLSAFFDDSGTHGPSEMVVWGGVIGTSAHLNQLDFLWGEMLAEPLPGRPRLRLFSAGDCRWANSNSEFRDYKAAERDFLRMRVRKIIQDSGVRSIAYAIPIKLFNSIIRGRVRRDYASPSGVAFASCADFAMQACERVKVGCASIPLACYFDKGQHDQDPQLAELIADAEKRAADRGIPISYGFVPVLGTYGMQAADTIATEHYWYSCELLADPNAPMQPHMESLVELTKPLGWTMGEEELLKMRDDYYRAFPLRDYLKRKLAGKKRP